MKNIGFSSIILIYLIILKKSRAITKNNKKGVGNMERKDFKKITGENLKTCRKIILAQGECLDIECEDCLFSSSNTNLNCGGNDEETLRLCEEALKKFGEKKGKKILRHHRITRNEMKKFYTYIKQKYEIVGERTNDLNSYDKLEEAISKSIDNIVERALKEQKERVLSKINSM